MTIPVMILTWNMSSSPPLGQLELYDFTTVPDTFFHGSCVNNNLCHLFLESTRISNTALIAAGVSSMGVIVVVVIAVILLWTKRQKIFGKYNIKLKKI